MKIIKTKVENKLISVFQRYEFKYILPEKIALLIENEISHFMTKDPYTINSSNYYVRSQYFENNSYANFYEKVDGMKERHKYRIRTYSESESISSPIYLERKSRLLERTFKTRIKLKPDDLDLIYNNKYEELLETFNRESFVERFVFDSFRKRLRPMVLIDYQRSPYISEYDTNFRLTFDRNIQTSICSEKDSIFINTSHWKKVNAGYCTLEVKFLRRFPPWFRRIIQHYHLRRISISKFSTGMEACGLAKDTGL